MTSGTVAYLGPRGTFSEEAAILYVADSEHVPYPTIREAAMAAESGMTDEAVLPSKNSMRFSEHDLDYLIHDSTLSIVGEVIWPSGSVSLLQRTRVPRTSSRSARTPALAQCQTYLQREFPEAELIASISTAGAVEEALEEGQIFGGHRQSPCS